MFLRAGALSLALLVASRLLGLVRESAQAAAFGASGLGDVAVLMLTLPDWLAGLLASGALAYALLPAWATQSPAAIDRAQRRLAFALAGAGIALGAGVVALRTPIIHLLAPGLPATLHAVALAALSWSAIALPLALLAALGVSRLQHERDFVGMYGANLVVNACLVAALAALAWAVLPAGPAVMGLGIALMAAMLLRLAWLAWRQPAHIGGPQAPPVLPGIAVWTWAALASGLPLALPFAARSIASGGGEGALSTFNYAWKLVELPLVLAVQLVSTLALPAVSRATARGEDLGATVRPAFALAWTLACAAAAALLLGAPAFAQILFGWGRMDAGALARIADWARTGAWGLLPQALLAVSLTVLAARNRLRHAAIGYGVALAVLLALPRMGIGDGGALMAWLNGLWLLAAGVAVAGLGRGVMRWMPWSAIAASTLMLAACWWLGAWLRVRGGPGELASAVFAAAAVLAAAYAASSDLRAALRR